MYTKIAFLMDFSLNFFNNVFTGDFLFSLAFRKLKRIEIYEGQLDKKKYFRRYFRGIKFKYFKDFFFGYSSVKLLKGKSYNFPN